MVVSVGGFTATGSGAVVDLLREYKETHVEDMEIPMLWIPDGIADLDYHVNGAVTYFNGDLAIARYKNLCKKMPFPNAHREKLLKLTEDYLDSLIQDKWVGVTIFDGIKKDGFSRFFWQIQQYWTMIISHFFTSGYRANKREMYRLYHNDCFAENTKDYISEVVNMLSNGRPCCVLNQFISAFNPDLCLKYVPKNTKAIFVDRDPRDTYLLVKCIDGGNHCFPCKDVRQYVEYVKKCCYANIKSESDKVLYVMFEDLVYNYEDTVNRIESFLGLKEHSYPKKYFNPKVSINNTQLKEKHLEYSEDVAYIEHELGNYLYPFPYVRKPVGKEF